MNRQTVLSLMGRRRWKSINQIQRAIEIATGEVPNSHGRRVTLLVLVRVDKRDCRSISGRRVCRCAIVRKRRGEQFFKPFGRCAYVSPCTDQNGIVNSPSSLTNRISNAPERLIRWFCCRYSWQKT